MNAVLAWILGSGGTITAIALPTLGYLHSHRQDKRISEQGNTTVATQLMERMEGLMARQDIEIREVKTDAQQLRAELATRDARDAERDRREQIRDTYIQQLRGDLEAAGLAPRPYPPELIAS